jgi:hypothetical protein
LPTEPLRSGKTVKAGNEIVSGVISANYDRLDHADVGHRLYKLINICLVRWANASRKHANSANIDFGYLLTQGQDWFVFHGDLRTRRRFGLLTA